METIDFTEITDKIKAAKQAGLDVVVNRREGVTADLLSKVSMLNLYCDTAASNVDAARNIYEELNKTDSAVDMAMPE